MRWLTAFFVATFVVGDVLFVSLSLRWDSGGHTFLSMLSGTFIMDLFFILPTVTVATIVRTISGRLSGFAAGVIGLVCGEVVLAVISGAGLRFLLEGIFWHGAQCLAAILLSRVPIFRDHALRLSPPAGIRGLARTSAFVVAKGDSLASALGTRSAAERRWATVGIPALRRWDAAVSALASPPREIPRRLFLALALGARVAPAWWSIAFGALTAPIWVWSSVRFWRNNFLNIEIYPLILPPIIGLTLLRFGALRLLQSVRLAQLLRTGELAFGAPDPVMIPNRRRDVVVVVPFGEERIAVQTRAPVEVTGRPAFLIDRVRRRVVAWDLLPFAPSVAADGSLVAPPPRVLVPGLLGLLAALLATAAAVVLCLRQRI